MAGKGSAPGERRGGREKGTPNMLPDLRALTLKALMKAGGVDYLERQAHENPGPFLGLLGKVMPREATLELTGELRIRQEVRRDLVEKVIVLMQMPHEQDARNPALEASQAPLPAITHNPDTMLKAQRNGPRETLSRAKENARIEGAAITSGVMQRASAMHLERNGKGAKGSDTPAYLREAMQRIDGVRGNADALTEGNADGREGQRMQREGLREVAPFHAPAPEAPSDGPPLGAT
jgi:hypothetical protein